MSAAVMTSPQAANVSSSAPANNRDSTPGAGDKAAPLKMKISTNHADGTSKVVSSNNSANKNHNHHHHHHHHHSSSSSSKSGDKKDGGGHKSSSGSSSHNKPVADGEKTPAKVSSGDKHKNHVSSKSSSGGDKNAVKPKDSSSSNSKPKENHTSSSKDGKPHSSSSSSSKPKDGSEKKSSSSQHNSSSNKLNSSSSGSKDGKSKSHLSSNDKNKVVSKDGTKSNSTSSSGDKHSSSKHNNSTSSSHKHSSSSSSKDPKVSSEKKKSSGGDNAKSSSGGGDSVKHKSSGDKSKHRDKENQEKDKQQAVKIKQEPGTVAPQKTTEKPPEKVKVKVEPKSPPRVKAEVLSDEDVPLAKRKQETPSRSVRVKQEKRSYKEDDDSEDEPLASRLQKAKKVKAEVKKRKMESDSEDEPISKRIKKEPVSNKNNKKAVTTTASPTKTTSPTKKKKEEEGKDVWKWWEEEKKSDGSKWHTLEHKGPVFAPEYEPLPKNVKFLYNGKLLHLSEPAEEVATMYAKFLEHDYTSKEAFNKNFFKDWRKVMTPAERETIMDLKKCDFKPMHTYFMELNEQRKTKTKEEKQIIKRKNEEMLKEFGFCVIDGHKEKIGNFKTEPPGLFRGRGEHPKMGQLKKRIMPEDVIINCSRGSKVPSPPPGHKWKEVRHDNTVTWLACWQENIQNQTKYIMLNPSSKLKGEKDWQKYETARKLKSIVEKIREQYRADWKSKEMKVRQRAVALYFIDKLALRAGNEKEEGETADTVGCCSLRVEHITLDEEKDGDENVVSFDFLGKDSIRYYNCVPVEKRVFKNLALFMDNKQPGDDLFDRLNTTILNKHLNELMDGLTAKVFRTFNASKTLQEQLLLLTNPDDPLPAKLLSYNRANRAVAILCNHQRAVPKTFGKSMENLQTKINDKKAQVKEAQKELKEVKKSVKNGRSDAAKTLIDKKEKALERLKDQLVKLDLQATDKEENKQIALGTSKLNYLDPRISVAWCKKWEVPIEKIYNKTQRDKFRWAIEMAPPDFKF